MTCGTCHLSSMNGFQATNGKVLNACNSYYHFVVCARLIVFVKCLSSVKCVTTCFARRKWSTSFRFSLSGTLQSVFDIISYHDYYVESG